MADDPREQIQQLVADARRDFATDVDALLIELRTFCDSLEGSLGNREDALRALRAFVLEKFDQRLPLKSAADPVLLQLVREAYDVIMNPESPIDLRDWARVAEPFVERELHEADVARLIGKWTGTLAPEGD